MYVQMVGKVRSNDCGSTYKWLRGYVCLCDRNLSEFIGTYRSLSELIGVYQNLSEFIRTYQSLSGRIGGVGGSAWCSRRQRVVGWAAERGGVGGSVWWSGRQCVVQ